jgi:glycosyltransferase involved in cell wall biosynthesis
MGRCMNVYINARFLAQPLSGVQRYAREILDALDRLLDRDEGLRRRIGPLVAFCPQTPENAPDWRHIDLRVLTGGTGHFWEQTTLAWQTRRGILISLGNSGPLFHSAQILTLHDAHIWSMPENFRRRYRLLHRTMRPMLARRAARLITVSLHSAVELSSRMGLPVARFNVIGNGFDHILRVKPDPEALLRLGLRDRKYLLCIGNQSPNKNVARLLEAHQLAGPGIPPLVVAGGAAPGVADVSLTYEGSPTENVHILGRVSDETLRSLYESAAGFVFPSLNEGFGIPPLEALALGTPVLASCSGALPEVLQEAAMYFDPRDVADMAATLCRFNALPAQKVEVMRARGFDQAERFTWAASAAALAGQILALQGTPAPVVQASQPSDEARLRKSA